MIVVVSLIAYVLTVSFIIMSAIIDSEHLNDQDYIEDHTSRFILRGIFALAIGLSNPLYTLGAIFIFMALFDQCLNTLMKNDLWFLGKTAKWDIFWTKNKKFYKAMKFICFLIGTAFYLINIFYI